MQVPDYTIDKKQTVAGQMDDLLKSDSPYMQQAATAGKQMAGSRGLLNSSMAAGAAQGAAISAAMPIAAQDAQTNSAFAGQQYGTQLQGAMNQQQQGFQQDNMRLTDTLQRGQNEQQFNYSQQALAQSTTANTQGKYLDALDQITNNAMVSINEIEVAEGITQAEKDKMIANTIKRRDADLAWTRNVYSNMPTWDFSWLDIESGSMPEAPGVA